MAADAYLVESLCSGALGNEDEKSEKAFEEVSRRYSEALAHIQIAPKDLDSVTQQLCLLALYSMPRLRLESGQAEGRRIRRSRNDCAGWRTRFDREVARQIIRGQKQRKRKRRRRNQQLLAVVANAVGDRFVFC